jgi:DNA-3-methyladenine glycosylase
VTSGNDEFVRCTHFENDVVSAAIDLIGRSLVVRRAGLEQRALIVESEAYGGADDPASHAAFRPGGRAALMAGPPGSIYVYAAYGMYPCLNIVTDALGVASAVLIRGAWIAGAPSATLGPGRLTRALSVTVADHGTTACSHRFQISSGRADYRVVATPRVGITRGVELPWRFVAEHVSGRRR